MNKIAKELVKIAKELASETGVADKEGKYENFTGKIDYAGTKGKVEHAFFSLKKGSIIWSDGKWKSGLWKIGTWKDGLWNNGTWYNGVWEKGIWKSGTWKDGKIFGRTFFDGMKLEMSFFGSSGGAIKLDKPFVKEAIMRTNLDILYTYGLGFRNPTMNRKKISKDKALDILKNESLLDVSFEPTCIHLNAYSESDMW